MQRSRATCLMTSHDDSSLTVYQTASDVLYQNCNLHCIAVMSCINKTRNTAFKEGQLLTTPDVPVAQTEAAAVLDRLSNTKFCAKNNQKLHFSVLQLHCYIKAWPNVLCRGVHSHTRNNHPSGLETALLGLAYIHLLLSAWLPKHLKMLLQASWTAKAAATDVETSRTVQRIFQLHKIGR